MRRVLFSLFATSLIGLAAGCCHTHGVCDCEVDDYCYTRQPYIHQGGITAPLPHYSSPSGEAIPAPRSTPMPVGKTREIPKELPRVKGL